MQLKAGAALHLLGVGGVGMSALAHLAAERGFVVSGSDARACPRLSRLRAAGIDARSPHGPLPSVCDMLVRSPALADSHPRLAEARRRALPILSRAELVAALLPAPARVAVAGAHGKSTTTAMVAHILIAAGRDPTVVLGADTPTLGGGHRLGAGPLALFEACEGYGALDQTPAPWACVTNIDDDHVEQFASFEAIIASFARLCRGASRGLALGVDDSRLRAWASELDAGGRALWSYGLETRARVHGIRRGPSECEVFIEGARVGQLRTWAPGAHNLRNALAALATSQMLEVEPNEAIVALASFEGVSRRLQRVGQLGAAPILDDYAHHPSEVAAAIEATRSRWPAARILAVFQPHLPSRERRLRARFATALAAADVVIVTPTYAVREPEAGTPELPLAASLERLGRLGDGDVHRARDLGSAMALTRELVRPGDVVLVMGAGDVSQVAHALAGAGTHRDAMIRRP